ncbi:site-specific integrase [Lysinibacillus sp. Bpr_S20]|uniref:tyrosine-type recombinase/integrase n=1 Tax=Lysinibacillus sp. Bpr_S20 TaxID=2933964 RepID=UPI002010E8CF|nr:site-specific integrase [Lysinibacillus sp. Bpr_S20]MCL1700751.1 site-specific integrase [Lysinibacillus sp. Bpr_S20]
MVAALNTNQNAVQMVTYIGDHINDFLNEYKKKSESSFKNYRSSLNKIFKDLIRKNEYKYISKEDIENLTVSTLKDYFNGLHDELNEDDEPKYKNATINRHISVIKELIRYLRNWDIISYDLEKLNLVKSLPDTREEIEMIPFDLAMEYADYFAKEEQGLEKSLIIKLATETALRASELLTVDWSNFTEVEDGVILKSNGYNKGKGNKEWIDKIDKELYEELLQLKEIGNADKLFNLTYKQLRGMMDRGNNLLNKTGIDYSFHSFKKLAVTMCYLNNGNCIDTAMKKARHSNVNTTMRYLRLTNLNVTGIISAKMNTSEELYKTVSHELLLECLEEMRPEMLLLLNNKIKNKTSESDYL